MNKPIAILFLAGMGLSTTALANCPPSLTVEETIECINYEGATSSYLDYTDDYAQEITSKEPEQASTQFATIEAKE